MSSNLEKRKNKVSLNLHTCKNLDVEVDDDEIEILVDVTEEINSSLRSHREEVIDQRFENFSSKSSPTEIIGQLQKFESCIGSPPQDFCEGQKRLRKNFKIDLE